MKAYREKQVVNLWLKCQVIARRYDMELDASSANCYIIRFNETHGKGVNDWKCGDLATLYAFLCGYQLAESLRE